MWNVNPSVNISGLPPPSSLLADKQLRWWQGHHKVAGGNLQRARAGEEGGMAAVDDVKVVEAEEELREGIDIGSLYVYCGWTRIKPIENTTRKYMFEYDKIALKSLGVFEDREESISSTRIATGHCRSTNFLPGLTTDLGYTAPFPLNASNRSAAFLRQGYFLALEPSPKSGLLAAELTLSATRKWAEHRPGNAILLWTLGFEQRPTPPRSDLKDPPPPSCGSVSVTQKSVVLVSVREIRIVHSYIEMLGEECCSLKDRTTEPIKHWDGGCGVLWRNTFWSLITAVQASCARNKRVDHVTAVSSSKRIIPEIVHKTTYGYWWGLVRRSTQSLNMFARR
ncbi:hypothetical protein BJ322DRAFT_1020504 [Thelephora terrestris]|uniref:Uncharacterized protein n=1 Tax=Thelephora terrestris TaxID=56493 RepID=A0A9P6HGM4_9AGAM|nr:hypothetical protein BJ322DRAFT_1020504 [Thelephora terrestris]